MCLGFCILGIPLIIKQPAKEQPDMPKNAKDIGLQTNKPLKKVQSFLYFLNTFDFLTKYWLSVFLISKSNNSLKATAVAKNYHGDG